MSSSLSQLLEHPALWQAGQQKASSSRLSTGFTALDTQLHYRGWPQGMLSELLRQEPSQLEWSLLLPALVQLSQQAGLITLVNPPGIPFAPRLQQVGLSTQQLLLVHLPNPTDALWASQQALASGACCALVCWLPARGYKPGELRKLALAARQRQAWAFVVRPPDCQRQASVAALRIHMQAVEQPGLQQLTILKQPGSWGGQKLTLNLWPEQQQHTKLAGAQWLTLAPQAYRPAKQQAVFAGCRTRPLLHQPHQADVAVH